MNEYLDIAMLAARRAGELAMKYFLSGVPSELKADLSPVTIADREAERLIIETIKSEFPDHGFLGEETGATRSNSEFTWIIDPIDGTRNFIRQIPLFGVQLALMQGDKLIVGVSNMPAMNELLYADSRGAFVNGQPISVSTISEFTESTLSFAGLNRLGDQLNKESLLRLFEKTGRVRAFGDCYAFHLIALGRAEAVIQPLVNIWDIAALCVIIEQAGGRCTDLTGDKIGVNCGSILASNGLLHDRILRDLNS